MRDCGYTNLDMRLWIHERGYATGIRAVWQKPNVMRPNQKTYTPAGNGGDARASTHARYGGRGTSRADVPAR